MRLLHPIGFAAIPLSLLLVSCGSDDSPVPAEPSGGDDAGADVDMPDGGADSDAEAGDAKPPPPPPPAPICLEPGAGPLALTFTDVTEELGLGPSQLKMTGSTVSVSDVDGDHWPDLVLTKGSAKREDPEAPTGLFRLLRNTGGTGFEDWTWTSGLFTAQDGAAGRATGFVVFADVDNDGDSDALAAVYEDASSTGLLDQTSILLNNGDGTYSPGPSRRFTSGPTDPIVGVAFLDYDKDGTVDVFVGHHYGNYGYLGTTIQDSLFRGLGAGSFEDVTDTSGVKTVPFSTSAVGNGNTHKPTWGVTACDLDGDGWTDLMTNSYGRQFNAFYRNTGGAFEDLTMTSGFAADANLDYTTNVMYICYCDAHPTVAACEGAPAPNFSCSGMENYWNVGSDDQPWRLGGNSSNAVCGDIDNDGDMDILAVELAHGWAGSSTDRTELLINDGFPAQPLRRPGNVQTGLARNKSGLNWNEGDLGGALADFDNDGRLDILVASSDYPGTYSLLWQQQADGTFKEMANSIGARVARAHGIGLIDFDRDGDYDIVLGTSLMRWKATDNPPAPDDAYAYVLRNDTGHTANKLMFDLTGGQGTNRSAVGATVRVKAGGTTYLREVQAGYGLNGFQHDPLVIIGIGPSCSADEVTIRWPDAEGSEQTFTDVLANYVLLIEQGEHIEYQKLQDYASP